MIKKKQHFNGSKQVTNSLVMIRDVKKQVVSMEPLASGGGTILKGIVTIY